MKLTGLAATKAAIRDLSPHFVILSGPDGGLLRRLAQAIAARHQKHDPQLEFQRFSEEDVRANPSCIEEAIGSASLFGGAAIAYVRVSGEKDASTLAALLEVADKGGPLPQGVLILDVGDIGRSSKSRKLFEVSPHAWSLQLYETSRDELLGIAREEAKAAGVSIDADALSAVVEVVAQDSDSMASEVQKLALYAGAGGVIDLAAVKAVGSGGREAGLDEAIDAAFSGHRALCAKRLEQALGSGANPVAILNGVGRRIRLLLQIRAGVEAGDKADEIVKHPRMGIFWKRQGEMVRQAGLWGRTALEDALSATLLADSQVKRAGSPDVALVETLLIRIATRAARMCER
ncbi:DNA polymerase III subunit delta [Candidatus Phycosocius spiralis]|uniref:DNA-directed DNA polymerase n=1 Tax=Candidatus Phycosocius spiralis TaxID=2815099 RepID=A0ABQ4PUI5_9PROT|nr:DNA polymerase III subunit delta [Candidatus Phycosocius spiralis]GIU66378.1 DNA polymerase III subunit delta [Candidatus Phycosocius spiralis]